MARMGRPIKYNGYTIQKLIEQNPRNKGSHGYNSWELIRDGMTYEAYIAAGGRRPDLVWEVTRGRVTLTAPDGSIVDHKSYMETQYNVEADDG